jgi:hypothetical protein
MWAMRAINRVRPSTVQGRPGTMAKGIHPRLFLLQLLRSPLHSVRPTTPHQSHSKKKTPRHTSGTPPPLTVRRVVRLPVPVPGDRVQHGQCVTRRDRVAPPLLNSQPCRPVRANDGWPPAPLRVRRLRPKKPSTTASACTSRAWAAAHLERRPPTSGQHRARPLHLWFPGALA